MPKKMTNGKIVEAIFKKVYFCKQTGWKTYESWDIQPEKVHLILLELKSKEAIDALMNGDSWSKRLPKALRWR